MRTILRTSIMALCVWILPLAASDAYASQGENLMTKVLIKTSLGDITLELNQQKAPKTVENFLTYVDEGLYNGTIFHRVIDNFMIQGGGFTAELEQKSTHDPIENEATNGLANARGSIAMARTNDVHSATAQFFINVKDNDFLNHRGTNPHAFGYCVFGKVTQGMDIVDQIKSVETGSVSYFQDIPKEPIKILEIKRL